MGTVRIKDHWAEQRLYSSMGPSAAPASTAHDCMSSPTMNAMREGGKKLLGDKRNNPTARFVRRWEEHWKGMFVPSTLFEEMGFHYTGPIDGHNLEVLVDTLNNVKRLEGPQFLHIVTKKGKGFAPAEVDPIGYHAITKLEPLDAPAAAPKKGLVALRIAAVDAGRDCSAKQKSASTPSGPATVHLFEASSQVDAVWRCVRSARSASCPSPRGSRGRHSASA